MTAMPGHAWSEDELRACSTTQVRSQLGQTASMGRLAQRSVDAMGWSGSVLPPVKLLGRQVIATAEVVPDAHAERLVFGSAVLSADGDDVREELPGHSFDDAPPVEHTAISRWVNEVVYQQLLSAEAPAPSRS